MSETAYQAKLCTLDDGTVVYVSFPKEVIERWHKSHNSLTDNADHYVTFVAGYKIGGSGELYRQKGTICFTNNSIAGI